MDVLSRKSQHNSRNILLVHQQRVARDATVMDDALHLPAFVAGPLEDGIINQSSVVVDVVHLLLSHR
jgi:hypothetical protein